MKRDFTYIDDIITGVVNVMGKIPEESEDGRYTRFIILGTISQKICCICRNT